MILYHGSNVKIDRIDLSKSNVGKDFGVGFYLTPNCNHALGQDQRKIEMFSFGAPTLNSYFFDENELQKGELAVKTFDGYTLEWAEFVLMNRQSNSRKSLHGYDVVVGPVANDTVCYQIRMFTHPKLSQNCAIFLQDYISKVHLMCTNTLKKN